MSIETLGGTSTQEKSNRIILTPAEIEALSKAPEIALTPFTISAVKKGVFTRVALAIICASVLLAPWTMNHVYGPLLRNASNALAIEGEYVVPFLWAAALNLIFIAFLIGLAWSTLYVPLRVLRATTSPKAIKESSDLFQQAYTNCVRYRIEPNPLGVTREEMEQIREQSLRDKDTFNAAMRPFREDWSLTFTSGITFTVVAIVTTSFHFTILDNIPKPVLLALVVFYLAAVACIIELAEKGFLHISKQLNFTSEPVKREFGFATKFIFTIGAVIAVVMLYLPIREDEILTSEIDVVKKYQSEMEKSCSSAPEGGVFGQNDGVICGFVRDNSDTFLKMIQNPKNDNALLRSMIRVEVTPAIQGSNFERVKKVKFISTGLTLPDKAYTMHAH